jgi:hypothetical protein
MSDTLSFTELQGQHVELLPDRTVMGVFDFLNAVLGGLSGLLGSILGGGSGS